MSDNSLTTTQPVGSKFTLVSSSTGNPLDVTVVPGSVIGPTGPTGPAGGTFTNLTATLYVDGGTTVAPADQNGNIETPFAEVQDAIDALPSGSGTVLVVPGPTYAAVTLVDGSRVAIKGIPAPGISLAPELTSLALGSNTLCTVEGCIIDAPVTSTAGGTLKLIGCPGTGVNVATDTAVILLGTSGDSSETGYGDITGGSVWMRDSLCGGLASAGDVTLTQSGVAGPTGPSGLGTIQADLYSFARTKSLGGVFSAPAVDVIDAPTTEVTVTVTGIAPAVEQVSVPLAGAEPGDAFALGVVDRDSTGCLVGAPACEVSGTLIVPVIAGVAGDIVLRVARLPVAAATG